MMSVFTWGLGKSGQLGNGSTSNEILPQQVPHPSGEKGAVSIATGGLFSAFLTTGGQLYTFGCGKYGRLGNGNEDDQPNPVIINSLSDKHVIQISCGSWHGAAVDIEGHIYIWGYGKTHGVLGQPLIGGAIYSSPLLVPSLSGIRIAGVACGNNYTLVRDKEGQSYSWGCGRYGTLGHGDTQDRMTPTKIEFLAGKRVDQLSAGFSHCAAVCQGAVFMWGQGKYGALGLGKKNLGDIQIPNLVKFEKEVEIADVSCSAGEHHGHTLAVSCEGLVYAWGDGYKGKLGLGHQESNFTPTEIPADHFMGELIIHVSSGGIHSSAVSRNGHIFTWGCGSDGRLGLPEAQGHRYLFRSDKPRMVESLAERGRAVQVAASYYHCVALVECNK